MSFTLDRVVPWGRSLKEYQAMFRLTEQDLQGRLLGCGDGPASFNAQLTKLGGAVVSLDPIYDFSAQEIQDRIDATYIDVLEQVRQNQDTFVWEQIPSPEALGQLRMQAMRAFLSDFMEGRAQGRYVTGMLPELPFADQSFALALCSHFLFLYGDSFSAEFHLQSVRALCRVAQQVRIFPLLELDGTPSRHLSPVMKALKECDGCEVEVVEVPYEFQRGGNQMLRIQSTRR